MSFKQIGSSTQIKGSLHIVDVFNGTGDIVTIGSDNILYKRTNSEIISDLNLVTNDVFSNSLLNYYTKTQLNTSGQSQVHWLNISNTPTTLAGYGITNAQINIPVGNISQYYRGDKTWSELITTNVPEGTNLYFTSNRVLLTQLNNYVTGSNNQLNSGDSILGAFGKLQTQLNNVINNDGGGTVTSVGLSVPTGFNISNSPITSSGTINIEFQSGYSLPSNVKQAQWDLAYSWGNHSIQGYALQSWVSSSYINIDKIGQPLGVASLDEFGKVPLSQWPADVTSVNGMTGDVILNYSHVGAQQQDDDLTSIASITGTIGLLKKVSNNNWILDTNNYALQSSLTNYIEINHPSYNITLDNINEWNEAYSWGNHSLEGYLTQTDLSNYVTTNTVQTIISKKILSGTSNNTGDGSPLILLSSGSGLYPSISFLQSGSYGGVLSYRNDDSFHLKKYDNNSYSSIKAYSFIKDGGSASQFLKADGSIDNNVYALYNSLGNYLPLSGGTMTGQIKSEVSQGTPPFLIDSSTKVDNLNADLLDGNHIYDILVMMVDRVVSNSSFTGIQNGINNSFTVPTDFITNSTRVYLNGVRQKIGINNDYIEVNNNVIYFIYPPETNDTLVFDFIKQ